MNSKFFAVAIICVAFVIVRCSDPVSSEEEPYTVTSDKYEPDSIPQASSLISSNLSQSRTLMSNDVDWVRFSAIANETLVVTATSNCSLQISLFNTDTVTLLAASVSADTITKLNYRIPASGVYFLKIEGKNSSSEGSYTLSLSAEAITEIIGYDTYEDDNTISKAKLLSGSSITQQRTLTYKDTDWVAIPVVMGHLYPITFSNSYVFGSLHTKDGTLLLGPSSSLSLNSSANDTVYVKIYSTSTVTINYILSLKVMLQPGIPDQYETDNTREHAKAKCFSSDSFLQDRTITVSNFISDTDWVAFPALSGKKYTIRAITSVPAELYIYLYSEKYPSNIITISNTLDSITHISSISDTLYLMIYCLSTDTSIAYTLSVQSAYVNDSFEPDSSRATAKAISTVAQTRIIFPSDTDWVKYTAVAGDSFAILTSGTADTRLALFSGSDLTPLLENDDIDEQNTNAMIAMKSELGGQFYIRVTGKNYGQYDLRVLSVSSGNLVKPDTFENDNSKSSATLIKGSSTVNQIRSLDANDTDWIALPVVAGGTYTVSASGSTSYSYLNIFGYTSGDSLIDSSTYTTNPSISYLTLTDDTLFFMISSPYIQQYSLTINIVLPPAPDSFEVDNTKEKAFKAAGSVSQKRSITVGDTDWISIPVVAGGLYVLTTNSNSLQIVLFNSSGTLLETSTSLSLERYASDSDTFYFQITAKSPQYVPTADYNLYLSVILPLSPDSYENDNTLAEAKMLLIDSTVQQRTLTPNDTDCASINLPSEGKLIINVFHTTDDYNTLYLYNSDDELLAVNSAYGVTPLMYAFETGGTYYCKIVGLRNTNFSYSLSAKFTKFDTLEVGKIYSRNLVPSDTQWVAIPLDSGKTYSVETNNKHIHLVVYDSLRDRNYLTYVFEGVNTFTSHRAGYFFIMIFSEINPASWNFTLKVTDNSTNESK